MGSSSSDSVYNRVLVLLERLRQLHRGYNGRPSLARLDAAAGVSQGSLRRQLMGMTRMSADRVFRLSELLGVRLEDVISAARRGLVPAELWLGEMAREERDQLRLLKPSARDLKNAPVDVRAALGQLDELLRLGKPEASETGPYLAALAKLEREPDEEAESLCLRTWELLGRVYRNSIHYSASAHCYREGLRLAAGQPLERARLLRRASYLASDQCELEQALYFAQQAHGIYLEHRALADEGRAWIDSASAFYYAGKLVEAIESYEAGLRLVGNDLFYRFSAHQGLGLCHVHKGDLETARRQMTLAQEVGGQLPSGPRQLTGLHWLSGEIALRAGDLTAARLLFREILGSDSCDSKNLEAAAASLRLAKVHLLLGDFQALEDLTARATLMLKPLQKHPFAQAALTEFYRLASERRLTPKILDRLSRELAKRGRASR